MHITQAEADVLEKVARSVKEIEDLPFSWIEIDRTETLLEIRICTDYERVEMSTKSTMMINLVDDIFQISEACDACIRQIAAQADVAMTQDGELGDEGTRADGAWFEIFRWILVSSRS